MFTHWLSQLYSNSSFTTISQSNVFFSLGYYKGSPKLLSANDTCICVPTRLQGGKGRKEGRREGKKEGRKEGFLVVFYSMSFG